MVVVSTFNKSVDCMLKWIMTVLLECTAGNFYDTNIDI